MQISKTIEEKQNKFLNRKELKLLVEAEKVPNKQEASSFLSKKENKPEGNIIIEKIKGKFGRNTFLITAKIYNTKEDKEKIERKKKPKKGEEKTEEKPAEPSEKKEAIEKKEQLPQSVETKKGDDNLPKEKQESKENKEQEK